MEIFSFFWLLLNLSLLLWEDLSGQYIHSLGLPEYTGSLTLTVPERCVARLRNIWAIIFLCTRLLLK